MSNRSKFIIIAILLAVVGVFLLIAKKETSLTGWRSPKAICKDGVYSYSKSRNGTCSGHGGVMSWF